MAACSLCLVAVPESNRRRRLHSQSSVIALTELKRQEDRCGYGSLASSSGSGQVPATSFLCKLCFSLLEKAAKTRMSLTQLESDVQQRLRQVAVGVGLEPCTSRQLIEEPGPLKRSIEAVHTPPPKRQRCTMTPVQMVVECTHAESSPTEPQTTPMKQSSEEVHTLPPKRKRLMITPVRKAVECTHAEGSPAVMVVTKHKSKARVTHVSRSLKKLGKGVGRLNRSSIARQAMNDQRIRERILNILGEKIRKEMKAMCSLTDLSILRDTSPKTLQSFKWDTLVAELQQKAPILTKVLRQCSQRTRKPSELQRKTRRIPDNHVVAICAAILLRHRNVGMNLVQRMMSVILYSGNAPKQLFTRMQKMYLCLSHPRSIAYVDILGKQHDAPVHGWRERIQQIMSTQDNVVTCTEGDPSGHITKAVQDIADDRLDVSPSNPSSTHSSPSSPSCSDEDHLETPEFSSLTEESSRQSSSESEVFTQVFGPLVQSCKSTEAFPTYKLVGDNLDKYVKPREMRSDVQSRMLNYFNVIAVRSRVDGSQLDDRPSIPDPSSIDVESMLPKANDENAVHVNFSILIARVLKKHMPYMTKFGSGLEKHILHEYSVELSQESEVVPLGILPKSEMSHEDMISILEHLHQYVPTESSTERFKFPQSDETMDISIDRFHHVLFGGDLLTAKRARVGQRIRGNSERGKHRLEGLLPIAEDWHAKLCLLTVIWKRLYSCSSCKDAGTLYHLRNLVNRRNVVTVPKNSVASCEEFFILVVEAHILTAAMELFGMSTLEDEPSNTKLFPAGSAGLDSLQRRKILIMAANEIVSKFVNLSYPAPLSKEDDHVYAYGREVLSLGLLLMEFNDAIREGDGHRILRCWRFFLPVFKASGRTNYSIEALNVLLQHDYLFSPRMKHQLLWERTVNVHGKRGKNISCDLHLEHVNRMCKSAMGSLGSNITDRSISRVGRCIGEVSKVTKQFDKHNGVREESGKHTKRSVSVDLNKFIQALHKDAKIFKHTPGREHKNFPKFHSNLSASLEEKVKEWMQGHVQELCMYQNSPFAFSYE